jgi:type I restriction enzyme, S subunit
MNNGFQKVRLADILTRSEEWIDIWPDKQYRQVTVRLWGKGVVLRDEVSGAEIAADRRFVIRQQQFVLSRIDARNGAFGIVPDSLDGAVVSSDFPVFAVDQSQILPKFLDWMSKTHDFVDLCKAASEGTTNRVRLKEKRFLAAEISLPPLEEQRRIIARIEELAARIEEARGLRREAEKEAETFFPSALVLQ